MHATRPRDTRDWRNLVGSDSFRAMRSSTAAPLVLALSCALGPLLVRAQTPPASQKSVCMSITISAVFSARRSPL
jgi:hypothetical protein